jgi:hypothetical protein
MTDGQDGRRKFQVRQDEIEAQAIEALERARMLPPGAKRHELLKAAGKLRMQVMVERLSGEGLNVSTTRARSVANRRRGGG